MEWIERNKGKVLSFITRKNGYSALLTFVDVVTKKLWTLAILNSERDVLLDHEMPDMPTAVAKKEAERRFIDFIKTL